MTGRDRLMESLTQTGAAEHGERGENQQEAGGMEKGWKRVEKKTDRYDRAEDGQAVREENEDHLEYEVITNESETMADVCNGSSNELFERQLQTRMKSWSWR